MAQRRPKTEGLEIHAPVVCAGWFCLLNSLHVNRMGTAISRWLFGGYPKSTSLFVCLIGLTWFPHEELGGGKWFGVALGLCGVVLIVGVDSLGRATAGQLLILAATCTSGIGVIYGRRLHEITPEFAAAGTLTSAAVILIPLSFWVETPLRFRHLGFHWSLAANATIATALGFLVFPATSNDR